MDYLTIQQDVLEFGGHHNTIPYSDGACTAPVHIQKIVAKLEPEYRTLDLKTADLCILARHKVVTVLDRISLLEKLTGKV